MVELTSAFNGVSMLVADDRVEEYLAAGCKLAANNSISEEKPKEAPKKRTTTKKTSKK